MPDMPPEIRARYEELDRMHLHVLRACFALGETGDWDPEAVVRELMARSDVSEDRARQMIADAVAADVITITEPSKADVIAFPKVGKGGADA